MKARILQAIRDAGGKNVTFVELRNRIGPDMDGDGFIAIGENRNSVVWTDVSVEFRTALQDLTMAKEVLIREVPLLAYLYDGDAVDLPLGRIRKGGHKSPHWIPIGLCLRDVK